LTLPQTMSPKRGPPFGHAHPLPPPPAGTMVPAAARSDILWREAETLDLDGGPLLRRFGLGLGSGGWGILRTGGWEGEGSRGIFGIVLKTICRLGFVLPKKHFLARTK
jgi:hypothetical protein